MNTWIFILIGLAVCFLAYLVWKFVINFVIKKSEERDREKQLKEETAQIEKDSEKKENVEDESTAQINEDKLDNPYDEKEEEEEKKDV